jgi:metallophosphoesterase superfamily enzyme
MKKLGETVIHPPEHPGEVDLDQIDIGHQHPMVRRGDRSCGHGRSRER